ncbi:unnamed protein product [Paramecium pentaurelia]|uniref:RNA-dependent RNA polymerase n=1 Tax=Paramecium pentaurelia TaxID=43138 RepID=A0A8S1UZR2_9CILI|nr:unnamed protein product [Paramecium pentaurelia]
MKSNNLNEQNCYFIKKVQEKLRKLEIQQIQKKYNILVEKAERLFGIVDQQGILKEGEVICVRKINDKLSYLEGQLIIIEDCIKSKQMILKVIGLSSKEVQRRFGDKKEYDEYINCIIFSNKQYLSTQFCTNTYFVSWDKRLIPKIQRINNKNKILQDLDFPKLEQEDIIDYLSDCLNNQITEYVECNHIGQYQYLDSNENIFENLDQIMMTKMQQHQGNDQNKVNIDDRFIYRFYWMKDENNYEKYVEQCLGQNHIVQALKCLNYIVDTFNGWMKLYNIKDEYEIYSGYFENQNDDENLDSFQELMILYLGQLKIELDNILSQIKIERQIQIWILHFLIIYLPNEMNIRNQQLERIVKCIKNQVQKFDECKFLCSRLETKSQQWFKGCSWFFFGKEILDFEQSSKNE